MSTGINGDLKEVHERLEQLLRFHLHKGDTAIVLKIGELELLFEELDTQAKQVEGLWKQLGKTEGEYNDVDDEKRDLQELFDAAMKDRDYWLNESKEKDKQIAGGREIVKAYVDYNLSETLHIIEDAEAWLKDVADVT